MRIGWLLLNDHSISYVYVLIFLPLLPCRQKCDGFLAASNKTDRAIDAVDIAHEGPEVYDNLWQKFRSITSYLYDNYYDKYDWFLIADDDSFIIVENLRLYLESEEIRLASNGGVLLPTGNETSQVPLLLGRRFAFKGDQNDIFPSGGAGMVLNKAALKMLVTIAINQFEPHAQVFTDDWYLACSLRKLGIVMYDTQDENKGERFMPFSVSHKILAILMRIVFDTNSPASIYASPCIAWSTLSGQIARRAHFRI